MSSNEPQSKGNYLPKLLIGVALMFGGMWVSKNWHPAFLETLEHQGVPLDPGKTVAVIGVFLILFPVIEFFYLKPLQQAISERTNALESTFTEAESLRSEMTRMKSEYEVRLQETEAKAREQIQAQIKEAQDLRKSLMAEATAKADELLKQAQTEIAAERDRVITQLRVEVANLSMQAAERILDANVDDARNRKLVDEFLSTVEVPSR